MQHPGIENTKESGIYTTLHTQEETNMFVDVYQMCFIDMQICLIKLFSIFFQMDLATIKTRLRIATVLQHYRLQPDKNGMLCCPFHEDKNPSMKVYYDTDTVYCFSGNCQTHGHSIDAVDFVMRMEKCSKHEAILKAGELAGLESAKTTSKRQKSHQHRRAGGDP
jgi:DNA primase